MFFGYGYDTRWRRARLRTQQAAFVFTPRRDHPERHAQLGLLGRMVESPSLIRLPRSPDTLWLRLLGRGRVQAEAIEEVRALGEAHPLRHTTIDTLTTRIARRGFLHVEDIMVEQDREQLEAWLASDEHE